MHEKTMLSGTKPTLRRTQNQRSSHYRCQVAFLHIFCGETTCHVLANYYNHCYCTDTLIFIKNMQAIYQRVHTLPNQLILYSICGFIHRYRFYFRRINQTVKNKSKIIFCITTCIAVIICFYVT